ncbi:Dscam [Cordylochernes scorpioides]|uniref:Dscam n=1 Tax=Cordylochernes scorpioides TaxID=51811 RepID=A0ABY6JZ22_9ARAC|nr:Dscam [Cordylochernes scorpioides]
MRCWGVATDSSPPVIKPFQFSSRAALGMKEKLTCAVLAGDGPFTFQWSKDGALLRPGGALVRLLQADEETSILSIVAVSPDHMGNYTCSVSGPHGVDVFTAVLRLDGDKDPPKIRPFQFSRGLALGKKELLTCTVEDGDGPFEFTWSRDGGPVDSSVLQVDEETSMLRIPEVRPEHVGNYTCRVRGPGGTDSVTASLRIDAAGGPPVIRPFHFSDKAALGAREKLTCIVLEGEGPFDFHWSKDGGPLVPGGLMRVLQADEETSILTISSVSPEHVGNYTCSVRGPGGADSFTAALRLNGGVSPPPKIRPFQFSAVLELGNKEKLTCTLLKGEGPFQFSWWRDDAPLDSTADLQVLQMDEETSMLRIPEVRPEHVGNYTCKVRGPGGMDSHTAALLLNGASVGPKIRPFQFSAELDLGKKERLTCTVALGDGPLDFDWIKDGAPLDSGSGLSVVRVDEETSMLRIPEVRPEHVGNYTCKVRGPGGMDSVTASLRIDAAATGAPKILPFLFSPSPGIGKREKLMCTVIEGTGPFDISWSKDGSALESSGPLRVVRLDEETSSLQLASVRAEDLGNYTCTVHGQLGADSFTAALTFDTMPASPKLLPLHFSPSPDLGKRETLVCTVTEGTGPFDISWTKDGLPLESDGLVKLVRLNEETSVLQIGSVRADHVGNYSCSVRSSHGSDVYTTALVLNSGTPLKIQQFQFSSDIVLGTKAKLTCTVLKGEGPFTFQWHKDGKPLEHSSLVKLVALDEETSILSIGSVQAEHVGNYSCTVTGAGGVDRWTAPLLLNESTGVPPKIQSFSYPSGVALGKKAKLTCTVAEGDGPFTFSWSKDGKSLEHSSLVRIVALDGETSILSIGSVRPEHVGNYSCTVTGAGGVDRWSAELRLDSGSSASPKIQSFHFFSGIEIGKKAKLTCIVVDGEGPFDFSWSKDGAKLHSGDLVRLNRVDEETSMLSISAVQPAHVGNYTCTVSGPRGTDSYTTALLLNTAVLRIKPFQFSQDVTPGQKEKLTCTVLRGEGPFSFKWSKDGAPLGDLARIVQVDEETSMLILPAVGSDHVGNYTCTVDGAAGSDAFTAALVFKGASTTKGNDNPREKELATNGKKLTTNEATRHTLATVILELTAALQGARSTQLEAVFRSATLGTTAARTAVVERDQSSVRQIVSMEVKIVKIRI